MIISVIIALKEALKKTVTDGKICFKSLTFSLSLN